MKKILEIKNLVKWYGYTEKFYAVKDISFDINEGDFIVLMGPSGAGKSTTLNLTTAFDRPSSGKVMVDGKNIFSLNEDDLTKFRRENLGFIFQEFNLLDTLTIRENITVPLTLAKVPKEKSSKRVIEVAKLMGIEEHLDKYPSECSGGQRQRAAICRALSTNPKLIVADEPTGNLDVKNAHGLLKMLKELNEKEKVTILLVTHDSMIASYSKKVMFIREGVIDSVLESKGKSQIQYYNEILNASTKDIEAIFTSDLEKNIV
ncbi:MAG: ABC transporter ATP-binding protein [Clostridium sp.]